MRILFRTDADAQIGTGHLMRCLALADVLRAEGADCGFLCRVAGLGVLAAKITDAGHALLGLPEVAANDAGTELPQLAHEKWLPGGWRNDVAASLCKLEGQPVADWLIVDHYALDSRWEQAMRVAAARIMVIDDLADRQHDSDLLLDQNRVLGMETRYAGRLPERGKLLLGPKYALLRAEFSRAVAASARRAVAESPRLLVMFGGADAQNLTLRTVKVLGRVGWKGAVDVVAGPLYPELESLKAAVAALPNARLHAPARDVAALMRGADLAVGSPGVASWERCVCSLPSLTIAQASNQEPIGEALAVGGAHWYLGRAETVSEANLEAALRVWQGNAFARQAMSAAAGVICDGQGVRRVVSHLLVTPLSIRPASHDEAELLFSWRNHERTRRQSLDSRPLELSSHIDWMEKTLKRTDVSLLVACRVDVPVACVRFDYLENRARVSIYTDPNLQGRGFGLAALRTALDWLRHEKPEIAVVEADVLIGNDASHKLFTSAGFRSVWTRHEFRWEA